MKSFTKTKYSWVENWKSEKDDRRVAYNLYKQNLEAEKIRAELKNAFCRVAILHAIREQERVIDEIIYRFTGLKWEDGNWWKG